MNIIEWFNAEDVVHARAYLHLARKGTWPPNFLPEDIEIPANWLFEINQIMALAFAERVDRQYEGM